MLSSWNEFTLDEVCTKITDGAHRSPKSVEIGKPMASVKDLESYGLNLENARQISDEDYIELVSLGCKPELGDILIAKDGNSALDKVCIFEKEADVVLLSSVAILKPNFNIIDSRFLKYYFLSPLNISYLKRNFISGAAIPRVILRDFKKSKILLPALHEQKAITHVLGALDDKIELNRQMNETLESMAQALFKSWFVDFDPVIDNALAAGNPIPDALKAKAAQRFEQLKAATQSGTLLAANRELFPSEFAFTEELGWIPKGWTVGAVKEVVKRLKINKTYTKKDVLDHGAVPVYEQGAKILLGYHNNEPNIKASINNPAFIFGDHTCINKLSLEPFSTSSNVITLIGKIYPTVWVYYAVKDKQSFEEYRRHWMEFIIKPVILPSLELTELFSEYTTSFQVKQMKIQNQNSDLAKLRDTLLPKLLSGELRIADAAALVEGV